jgi:hypothetical protein
MTISGSLPRARRRTRNSQLGRLLAERLRPAQTVLTEEIRGLFSELICALQRKT